MFSGAAAASVHEDDKLKAMSLSRLTFGHPGKGGDPLPWGSTPLKTRAPQSVPFVAQMLSIIRGNKPDTRSG